MSRFPAVLLVALLSVLAGAQVKLKLEFPGPGPKEIWVGTSPSRAKDTKFAPTEAQTFDFEPATFGPGSRLYVLDQTTGNLASQAMDKIAGGWKFTAADFSAIASVRVRVEHEGRPVKTATVSLDRGGTMESRLIDADSAGEVVFYGLKPGAVPVEVQVKTVEGAHPPAVRQSFEVPLKRPRPEPVLIVSIQDDVATLEPGASTAASGRGKSGSTLGGKSSSGSDGGGFGNVVSFLLALAVAAVAVFFGLKWLKANQDRVQSKLTSMGVEIPKPGDGAVDATPAPHAPIAPPPPAQILLDDASPDPLGIPAMAASPTSTGEPRLVSDAGDALPLDEGVLTVGREAGLGLSLINESTVSRSHAEIVRAGTSVRVRDLGSTNGTFVNGVQVTGEAELRSGDQVQFGAVRFRFEG